jgi:hypothetical protein
MTESIDLRNDGSVQLGARLHGGSFALSALTMVFESLLTPSRVQRTVRSARSEKAHVAPFGFALDGRAGDVYNEGAFRHFLAIERMRAQRSERSFLLLLVSLRKCPTTGIRVPPAVSSSLLSGLGLCVREVDFIGWYREGRVAGAVLAQGLDLPGLEAPGRIVERVTRILGERLPRHIAERLRVRVVQLGSVAK